MNYKIAEGISLLVWSQPGYELQLLQIKKLSWKASRNEEDCRVLNAAKKMAIVKSAASRKVPAADARRAGQCCGGFPARSWLNK